MNFHAPGVVVEASGEKFEARSVRVEARGVEFRGFPFSINAPKVNRHATRDADARDRDGRRVWEKSIIKAI